MERPTVVSVVTPLFNSEAYVRATIESVLSQEGATVEYIVVDGASTDGTMQIVREYADRISAIISEADSGMYQALNKGFARASGDILCYLNGDDKYLPGALRKVVDCFASHSIDLCFGNCVYVDSGDRQLFRHDAVDLPYEWVRRLGRIPFAQPAAFWSRGLFQKVGGFDESYRYSADTKFLFECLRNVQSRKQHIADDLAVFRVHPEGFSAKAYEQMKVEHHRVLHDLGIRPRLSRFAVEAVLKWKNRRNLIKKHLSSWKWCSKR